MDEEGNRGARLRGALLTRRALLRLAVCSALAGVLSSCDVVRAVPSRRPSGKVQLVYQDWRTEWFPPMVQQMMEQFHAAHPNIRVYYTPDPDNLEEKMPSDMRAGTAPDVFQGCCAHFPVWAQQGHCLDLSPYVVADLGKETIEDWDPAQYNYFFTRARGQYALPKYHGALALYYNKGLLDEAGVDYPDDSWTHDDYLQAMRRLTRSSAGAAPSGAWGSMTDISWDRLQVHVNAWGGHYVDPADPAHCLMAEPEAMGAFTWLHERMWGDQVMARPLDVRNLSTRQAFVTGRVAMVEDGSWALKDILAGAQGPIGVAPMPAGPARRATLTSTDGFAIYSRTQHPDAAWELLKFLVSKDYGRAMAKASFLQPARASLVEEWARYVRSDYPQLAKDMDLAAFADGQLKGYSVTAEVFANMDEARRIALAAWERIYVIGEAPVTEMAAACARIDAAQKGGG